MNPSIKARHRAQKDLIRVKLPGDLARRFSTVLERHRRRYADNAKSSSLAKIVGDIARRGESEFSIQIRGNISKGKHGERLYSCHRKWIACKMHLKKTAGFLDGEGND